MPGFLPHTPAVCRGSIRPLGSAGGGLHLEGCLGLVNPSHRACRADPERAPGQRSQAAGAHVILGATREGLLDCLGPLDGCGVAAGL